MTLLAFRIHPKSRTRLIEALVEGKWGTYSILVQVGERGSDRSEVLPSELESPDLRQWGVDSGLNLSWDRHDVLAEEWTNRRGD